MQPVDLSDPQSYRIPEVLSAAQAVARLQSGAFGVSEHAMLERLLAGQYPKMVGAYLQAAGKHAGAAQQCRAKLQAGCWEGRRIEILDHAGEILVHGAYDADLGREVLRAGGHWCGRNLRNRRCFVVPLSSLEVLLQGLQRWLALRQRQGAEVALALAARKTFAASC